MQKNFKDQLIFFSFSILLFAGFTFGATETIIDNTEAASHGTRSDLYFSGVTYYAQAFTMASNSGTISSFIVQDAYINPWTSGYLFKIYSRNSDGTIGSSVLNFNSSASNSSGLLTLTPSATYVLRAGTSYWVVGAMSSGSTFYWKYKNTAYSGTGSVPSSYYRAKSTNSGSSWVYDDSVSSSAYGTGAWNFDFKLVINTTTTYTLSYTAGTGGTLTGTANQYLLAGESGTEVVAVPNTGYSFSQWSDGSTTASRTDSNLSTSTSLTASFTPSNYNVVYTAGTGGSISGSSTQIISHGSDASEIVAIPDTGYTFSSWDDDSTSTSRTDTNITANATRTASFTINTYTLEYTAGTGGSLTGTASQTINHGSNGTAITAVPDAGYSFSQWSDGSTVNPRTDTNITANTAISATFVQSASSPPRTSVSQQVANLINAGKIQVAKNIAKASNLDNKIINSVNEKESIRSSLKDVPASIENQIKIISIKLEELKSQLLQQVEKTTEDNRVNNNYFFSKNLEQGINNQDVFNLQKFLNNNGFIIADNGPGSLDNETNYFGEKTREALIKFQEQNNIYPPQDYFGEKTRQLINPKNSY